MVESSLAYQSEWRKFWEIGIYFWGNIDCKNCFGKVLLGGVFLGQYRV